MRMLYQFSVTLLRGGVGVAILLHTSLQLPPAHQAVCFISLFLFLTNFLRVRPFVVLLCAVFFPRFLVIFRMFRVRHLFSIQR